MSILPLLPSIFEAFANISKVSSSQPVQLTAVNSHRFLAFLFVTLFHYSPQRNPRNSRYPGEAPPGSPNSPFSSPHASPVSPMAQGVQASGAASQAEMMAFVTANLAALLASMAMADSASTSVTLHVSAMHVDAIGLFLNAGDHRAAVWDSLGDAIPDFFDAQSEMTVPRLVAIVTEHMATGDAAQDEDALADELKPNQHRPTPSTVIQGQSKCTISQQASGNVTIAECTKVTIYLLSPMAHVRLVACTDCTVFLGAVAGTVQASDLHHVTVIASTAAIRVSACSDCTFNVLSNTMPAMLLGCRASVIGPYNSYYDTLETDLEEAGISPTINQWDRAVFIGCDQCGLMSPDDFQPFLVPFSSTSATLVNPSSLPEKFSAALRAKLDTVAELHSMMRSPDLPVEGRVALEDSIQKLFKLWLGATGNARQITELLTLEDGAE